MLKWIYLAIGGIVGVNARYALAGAIYKRLSAALPSGTLVVNLTGCLFVGLFNSLAEEKLLLGPNERILFITGFCGAYTTFSTLIMETSNLVSEGELLFGLANLVVSVVLGFGLFRLGMWVGKVL